MSYAIKDENGEHLGFVLFAGEGENMKYESINFAEKLSKFNNHWSPRVIAEMNDYQFKLAKVQGEFVWHDHPHTDEVFIVIEGTLDIEFREGKVTLNSGEMFVIPKGAEHKPSALAECKIMLIEPRGVVNTGESESELTAENDAWV
jgi:mannose-6-phosphate isomerase-like protein (cupin superfamily)